MNSSSDIDKVFRRVKRVSDHMILTQLNHGEKCIENVSNYFSIMFLYTTDSNNCMIVFSTSERIRAVLHWAQWFFSQRHMWSPGTLPTSNTQTVLRIFHWKSSADCDWCRARFEKETFRCLRRVFVQNVQCQWTLEERSILCVWVLPGIARHQLCKGQENRILSWWVS